jgi:hypothetical protein
MKKLILILITISALFSKDLPNNIEVNECFSDVYYINDMFVLKKDAEYHKNVLRDTILAEKYNNDKELMDSLVSFELLYNYSAREDFGNTPQAFVFDALEAMEQLKDVSFEVGSVLFLADWLIGGVITNKMPVIKDAKKALAKYLITKGLSKEIAEILADEVIINGIENAVKQEVSKAVDYNSDKVLEKDLSEIYDRFDKSLLEGHGIAVVTFGQGNLFSIQALRDLTADNWKTDAMGYADDSGVEIIRNYIYAISI